MRTIYFLAFMHCLTTFLPCEPPVHRHLVCCPFPIARQNVSPSRLTVFYLLAMSLYTLSYDTFSHQMGTRARCCSWLLFGWHSRKLYLFEIVTVLHGRKRHSRKYNIHIIHYRGKGSGRWTNNGNDQFGRPPMR